MPSPSKPSEAPTELPVWAQNCPLAQWAHFCYSNGMKLWGLSESDINPNRRVSANRPSPLDNGPPIWAYLEPGALDCYYGWKIKQWLYGKLKLGPEEVRRIALGGGRTDSKATPSRRLDVRPTKQGGSEELRTPQQTTESHPWPI